MRALFEKIPIEQGRSFVCREFRVSRFSMPWHFHPEVELTFIASGRGTRCVGDHVGRFDDGDLVLVGSNLPHFWWKDAGDRRQAHSVVVQFGADFPGAEIRALPEAARVAALLARAGRGLQFTGPARQEAAERMRAMAGMAPWPRLVALLGILGALADMKAVQPLASAGFAPVLDRRDGHRLAAVCGYVNEHYADPIAQPEVARRIGLSPAAFSRYFHRRMGKTFEGYVNEVRVGHACRRLLDQDVTIAEAAFAAGYNNLANFNRRFRAVTGLTPTTFRAAHRGPAFP